MSIDAVMQSPSTHHALSAWSALEKYCKSPLFGQPSGFMSTSPYRRPVRPQDVSPRLLQSPLRKDELHRPEYLQAQRLLMNGYEQDLVFLPQDDRALNRLDFDAFYERDNVRHAKFVRPALERFTFDWLEQEVSIGGQWSLAALREYASVVMADIATGESSVCTALLSSKAPRHAARFFMIQCAGDFLSESSAMGRNVLGNFGAHTSELFKIMIDEYGYGVHTTKHSSIFERLMQQMGLSHHVHDYWQFYTASSLSLVNYFHYLSANHDNLFRYLGALYFTEASLAHVTKKQSATLKAIFGQDLDTAYFDEHHHIDKHHGRMALEKLIAPMVEQYGESIVPDVVRGFEELRLLQDVADEDLCRHLQWHDTLEDHKALAGQLRQHVTHVDQSFEEPQGELSVPHQHPVDELFQVQEGAIEIVVSPDKRIELRAGEGLVIPHGLLHGSLVISERCRYTVTAVEAGPCK